MRKHLLFFLLIFFFIVGLAGWLYLRPHSAQDAVLSQDAFVYRTTSLKLGGATFELDIADTSAKKERGLGGRPALAADRGMVFPYDQAGRLCFWMKGMRFAIDILWLDSAKKVISVEKSLSPNTYPQTFCPDQPAQYVVELPAGASDRVSVKIGDILPLEL